MKPPLPRGLVLHTVRGIGEETDNEITIDVKHISSLVPRPSASSGGTGKSLGTRLAHQ